MARLTWTRSIDGEGLVEEDAFVCWCLIATGEEARFVLYMSRIKSLDGDVADPQLVAMLDLDGHTLDS